uniref:Uncharacterized protein n=1 Tax=Arion vulgaris TaxID=1028688 RepID=A0A0B7BMV0_9EUPU
MFSLLSVPPPPYIRAFSNFKGSLPSDTRLCLQQDMPNLTQFSPPNLSHHGALSLSTDLCLQLCHTISV